MATVSTINPDETNYIETLFEFLHVDRLDLGNEVRAAAVEYGELSLEEHQILALSIVQELLDNHVVVVQRVADNDFLDDRGWYTPNTNDFLEYLRSFYAATKDYDELWDKSDYFFECVDPRIKVIVDNHRFFTENLQLQFPDKTLSSVIEYEKLKLRQYLKIAQMDKFSNELLLARKHLEEILIPSWKSLITRNYDK